MDVLEENPQFREHISFLEHLPKMTRGGENCKMQLGASVLNLLGSQVSPFNTAGL